LSSLNNKTCIVTGSNSGIGKATATQLAEMGATVVMAVRNPEKGKTALGEIVAKTGNTKTELMNLDVSSKESIKKFVEDFTAKHKTLNILVNNAGAEFAKRKTTPEGLEATFATDYLGPFRLTNLLIPALKAGAPSRVINVTSGIQGRGKLNLDDLQSLGKYDNMKAYANAKHMLTMFTYTLSRHLAGSGVTVYAFEPGFVATNLGKNSGSSLQSMMFGMVKFMQISPEKAAESLVYLATSPELEGVTGKCFAGKQEKATDEESRLESLQERLWEVSCTYQ
jgi:NAD(P)-dependent dehydrogenase (short-subunit alcohol dehydrogenase family)